MKIVTIARTVRQKQKQKREEQQRKPSYVPSITSIETSNSISGRKKFTVTNSSMEKYQVNMPGKLHRNKSIDVSHLKLYGGVYNLNEVTDNVNVKNPEVNFFLLNNFFFCILQRIFLRVMRMLQLNMRNFAVHH
jgi:hypothetical protein